MLHKNPDFAALDHATAAIAAGLDAGALVVYETTLPVGHHTPPVRPGAGDRFRV